MTESGNANRRAIKQKKEGASKMEKIKQNAT